MDPHEGATGKRRSYLACAAFAVLAALWAVPSTALGADPIAVDTESQLRAAWADPLQTEIELTDDIFLRACQSGGPIRESQRPMTLDGNGHTIRQTCFEKRLLRQDGTGFLLIKDVTLTRGGNDGPGAAVTTRGEIVLRDSKVMENLSEEPGGGIFSQRRATIIRSVITGNLANDDGGGVYARRGGIQVFDSIISNNLVDGSGGALGCSSLKPCWTASEGLLRLTVATKAAPAAIATTATTAALASLRGNLRLFDDRRGAVKATPFPFFHAG